MLNFFFFFGFGNSPHPYYFYNLAQIFRGSFTTAGVYHSIMTN